jgi:hypothetical protein
MIKTYKANTNVSINVVLPSEKNLHIAFVPLSDGSSSFTTDNEDLQKAIESHSRFGKLFKLFGAKTVAKRNPAPIEQPDKNEMKVGQEEVGSADSDTKESAFRKVKVSDIGVAKDYLADTFGVSRTSMRSTKAILEQAAIHGIEFEGL